MPTIIEIADVFNGKTPSKGEQRNEGLPILKIRDIDENGKFVGIFGSYVDKDFYKKYSRKKLRAGDTIILNAAHSADYVGNKNALVSEDLDGTIATGEWLIVRPKKADSSFINHFLKSPEGRQKIKKEVKGIHLYPKDVERIKIPLPTIVDQIRIATLLSRVEALIATRKDNLRLLDEFLKSTFLEMFGDPVRNERGWELKDLGEIFKIKHGFAFKSQYFTSSGEYVLLTPGNFHEEGGYRDRGDKQKYYAGEIPIEYLLKKNDLLVAMTEQAPGLLGSPIIVPESNRFLHNQRLGLVELKIKQTSRKFLFYLFNTKGIRGKIHLKATGTKVRHTSPTKIEQITIGFPPFKLQEQFATIADKAESLKNLYQQSLIELENLYGALSQKAFKGELDLSRIPLEKVFEGTVLDATFEFADQSPEPDSYAMSDPAAREKILRQLFDAFIAERKGHKFSMEVFWTQAEQKVLEHMEDECPPLGVADYDKAKEWLFELIKSGNIRQLFYEENNYMGLSIKR
jgi:type I restriction enzyme S subunit